MTKGIIIMRARLLGIALATIAGLTIFGSTGASAQGTPLFAVLLGGNECETATGECRKGDLDGFGGATIILLPDPETPRVCFGIAVDNLQNVAQAHIHRGTAGLNGDIVIALNPPSTAPGNPRAWAGCVTAGVTNAIIGQIRANPSNFYVNVHTNAPAGFPGGAVRGQLF
jgi:hypothetical protein